MAAPSYEQLAALVVAQERIIAGLQAPVLLLHVSGDDPQLGGTIAECRGQDEDRRELQRRARSKGAPAREVEQARIVLLAAEGMPGKQIAARVGCAEPTEVTW